MRFNDRNYAILGIPDLPINAFKHIGDRKIKPQGGVSSVVDSVTGAVDDAVGSVSDALAGVDDTVNETIPGGWATVAAVTAAAVGVPGLPVGAETAAGTAGAGAAGAGAGTALGTGTAAGTAGTGLSLGGSGLGLSAGGGSLGLTAGSAGAGSIGAGIGSTLAGISTGIGTGAALGSLASGAGSTVGAMTPANYSLTGATTGGTGLLSTLGSIGSSALDFAKANPSLTGSLLGAGISALGASNAPTSQTATTSIDPQIKAEYLANLERAKTTAAGLEARRFEGFTPDYLLAEAQAKNLGLGGAGQRTTDEATRLAMIEAGFTPQQIQAATAGNASLANAQGYTAQQIAAAQANRGNVANVGSAAGSQYMSAYQNPFEEQVVQGALGDIERSRLMQEQANRAQAISARAFGGSRQGVVSGMTSEAALRQAATTGAQLRQAGFNTAAQLGQSDAARQLQAQLANQGIDVTLEQANAQLRQQGLLSNQGAFNQAAQFGAGATNQANLTNAAALNQMAQYNASLQQQAALANQGAFAQGAGIRQAAIGQLGQLGAQQQNLGLTGANAVMEAQMRQQALAQARLDAARNLGTERLGITSGALGLQPANVGQTSTQPLYSSTTGSLLSGGLTGAYIGSLLGKA